MLYFPAENIEKTRMKLIASYTSPYARKVRVAMVEKRIECDFVQENVWAANTTANLYNPLGKIPALILDDGLAVYDSRVIVEYLDSISPVSRLIPENGRDRLLVKRWEALGDGIADAGIAVFLERKRPEAQQSADWINRQIAKAENAITAAANELGNKDFCHGTALSLADISLGCALLWLEFRLPHIKWRETYPNLKAWIEKLELRASFVETVPRA
jgi:glutathione S-transferase